MDGHKEERRKSVVCFSHEELDAIVEQVSDRISERVSDLALQKMEDKIMSNIGRTVVDKFLKVAGVVVVTLTIYFSKIDLHKFLG